MELALFVYLASILPNVAGVFLALTTASVLYFLFYLVFVEKVNKLVLSFAVIFAFMTAIIPSEKAMWMMAGGYAAQSVYKSEISDDIQSIIRLKIKNYLKEIENGPQQKSK